VVASAVHSVVVRQNDRNHPTQRTVHGFEDLDSLGDVLLDLFVFLVREAGGLVGRFAADVELADVVQMTCLVFFGPSET
jgi:hypothetical protein